MKAEKSRRIFEEFMGSDASWTEIGGAEVVDGYTMLLALLDTWIATHNVLNENGNAGRTSAKAVLEHLFNVLHDGA